MRWFAAHLVKVVEFEEHPQDHFPVWENIVLVQAASEAEAYRTAEGLGRAEEGDEEGTFRLGQRPAKWVFAGVRKLTECALFGDRPEAGDEVSYIEFQFKKSDDVRRFVEGKSSMAMLNERYREMSESELRGKVPSKGRGRKQGA